MALIISSDSDISIGSQRIFFRDHIGPWMGSFFRDMQEANAAHFYQRLACHRAAIPTAPCDLVRRLGTAEEVAYLVGFLVSDYAGFITGADFALNGGQQM